MSEECSHNTQDETATNLRFSLRDTFCVVLAHEAFCCRPVRLLLHTGPLVHTPQCYSSTVSGPLPMVQLTPCDYEVIGLHDGDYWCEDAMGVQSNKLYWRKERSPVPEQLVGSEKGLHVEDQPDDLLEEGLLEQYPLQKDLLNVTLIASTYEFESFEEGFSNGQKQIVEEVETDGATVTQCGELNLTGNTMFLTGTTIIPTENITCPAQREKDEYGVERYWPAIDLGKYGRTQTYSHFCLFCLMVLIAMGDFMLLLWYK